MASKSLLVVAFDFGTTYSGYAYSFRHQYEKDPLKVFSNNFAAGSKLAAKVPTCVLFCPDKKFDCFGQEAEDKYARMCKEDRTEATRWYYFERFKMKLHKNPSLRRDTVLLDQTKKKGLPALDVFSAAIAFMKDHLLKVLYQRGISFKKSDINWVLTIPAIWDDNSKNFMREAAEKAEIPRDRLELALEPEAASVYCLEYNKAHQTLSKDVSLLQPGTKFMMVDCGGGTVDISVFELRAGNTLRQLHHPEGSPDGGTKVDEAFDNFVFGLVGMGGTSSFDRMEMLALRRELERTKRTNPKSQKVAVGVPSTVKLALEEGISESNEYAGRVGMLRNRLMIDLGIYRTFFDVSATSIVKYIQTVLDDDKVGQVDAILLAGGFSESDVIQEAVRKAFSRDRVLVAPSPSAAVLTGAVMLGHSPNTIATRVSAYTYGVDCAMPFDEKIHDPKKKVTTDRGDFCTDLFNVYIKKGQEVEVNSLLPGLSYLIGRSNQHKAAFSIFKSTKKSPMYVDEEGCQKVGSVTIALPDSAGGEARKIKTGMMVGGTEVKFIAREDATNTEVTVSCDFLYQSK